MDSSEESAAVLRMLARVQTGQMAGGHRFKGPGMLDLLGGLGLSPTWLQAALLWLRHWPQPASALALHPVPPPPAPAPTYSVLGTPTQT